jgi:hypothetical protein
MDSHNMHQQPTCMFRKPLLISEKSLKFRKGTLVLISINQLESRTMCEGSIGNKGYVSFCYSTFV